MPETYICPGCAERKVKDSDLRFYECCGMELCRDCQPYHADICPVASVEAEVS